MELSSSRKNNNNNNIQLMPIITEHWYGCSRLRKMMSCRNKMLQFVCVFDRFVYASECLRINSQPRIELEILTTRVLLNYVFCFFFQFHRQQNKSKRSIANNEHIFWAKYIRLRSHREYVVHTYICQIFIELKM